MANGSNLCQEHHIKPSGSEKNVCYIVCDLHVRPHRQVLKPGHTHQTPSSGFSRKWLERKTRWKHLFGDERRVRVPHGRSVFISNQGEQDRKSVCFLFSVQRKIDFWKIDFSFVFGKNGKTTCYLSSLIMWGSVAKIFTEVSWKYK